MKKEMVTIRGVDEEVFRKFKAKAIDERMKMGEALTVAMKRWLKEKEGGRSEPDPKNLLKLKGIIKTRKKVRWSEEIDEILYGGKT